MTSRHYLKTILASTVSVFALANAASAQQTATEQVTVTGTRIENGSSMPTPTTVVSLDQLNAQTPTSIPEALAQLPMFAPTLGTTSHIEPNGRGFGTPTNNLNVHGLGVIRTLILMDGNRVPGTFYDTTVNVDTLPQILVQRVDVVTGGASAVYGSDAVSGVVNFILNKNFTGLKVQANSGISTYGDAATYKVAAAAGTSLFGGRGHFEMSVDYFHADPVYDFMRPEPGNNGDWILTGAGTKANPFVDTPNGNLAAFSFGGKITCAGTTANPCLANGQQFVSNGVIGPFNPGTPTGTANISSGGDGTHSLFANVTASANLAQAYGRFSYNLDDNITFWASVRGAEGENRANFVQSYIQTGNVPNVFFKNNPFLPAGAQALLAGGTSNTFQMSKYNMNLGYANSSFKSIGTDRVLSAAAGL